ncbi:MAG: TIGR04282 family arsenosugar biosynthesis glycosyltransferase [Acidobacteriota bacterium]
MKLETLTALLIFARYPRLGRVKTRLAPVLDHQQRLELYESFLMDTLERTAGLSETRFLYLADCSKNERDEFIARHRLAGSICVRLQQGEDLGDRLWQAYQEMASRRQRVIFIGSDSPTLPLDYVREGLKALKTIPVVLGPGHDGGYYLIGLSEPRRELFYGIDWGSSAVLNQTLAKLEQHEFRLLPPWYDVDVPADLRLLEHQLEENFEGYPHRTAALLRQSKHL